MNDVNEVQAAADALLAPARQAQRSAAIRKTSFLTLMYPGLGAFAPEQRQQVFRRAQTVAMRWWPIRLLLVASALAWLSYFAIGFLREWPDSDTLVGIAVGTVLGAVLLLRHRIGHEIGRIALSMREGRDARG